MTMCSKTTVNYVSVVIMDEIRGWISTQITDMVSVEINKVQDTTQDQCSIVLRFVDIVGTIHERL